MTGPNSGEAELASVYASQQVARSHGSHAAARRRDRLPIIGGAVLIFSIACSLARTMSVGGSLPVAHLVLGPSGGH